MADITLTALGVADVSPAGGDISIGLRMTTHQRFAAVETLLGSIPEPDAYRWFAAAFPEWFPEAADARC